MSRVNSSVIKGARQALAYAKGRKTSARVHKIVIPDKVDVKAVRDKLAMSRNEFSDRFGFSLRTLEKWEQGIRQPERSARAYLLVIAHNHQIVESVLARSQ